MRDKTRLLTNIIEWVKNKGDPTLLFFLDADKAFDHLDWGFLKTLKIKMGFGPFFQQWVNLVYSEQCIKMVLEGQESAMIEIRSGVRQGCPISPLLFNMAIEILAIAIRDCKTIHGVKISNSEIKLS